MSLKSVIAGLLFCIVSFASSGQPNAYLTKADELYKAKKFTESFELYSDLFKQNKYSPAMLLRMAYIQEGLGHISRSLYYLTIYYKVTHNPAVLPKIEEMAINNKLQGYQNTPSDKFFTYLEEKYVLIAGVLTAIPFFLVALAVWFKRHRRPVGLLLACASVVMVVLLLHVNFSLNYSKGIIANPYTYIMSGPSAGADVITISGEGHQLEITGKKDVWIRVRWEEKEAWVREGTLLIEKI